MNFKLLMTVAAGLALVSGATSAAPQAVAKITSVEGQALVETAQGVRQLAQADMLLAEGSNLIVLENGQVGLEYVASQCQIMHTPNTLLTVSAASQCAVGQHIAVGQAGGAVAASGAGAGVAGAGAGVSSGALVAAGLGTAGLAGATAGVAASAAVPAGLAVAAAAIAGSSPNDCSNGATNNPNCPRPPSP